MMTFLQRFANRLHPLRYGLVVIFALSVISFGYITLSNNPAFEPYLLPALVLAGWSLCLFGLAIIFRTLPEPISLQDGFFIRLKKRIARLLASLLGFIFIICNLAFVYFAYKSISLVLANG